MTTTKEHPATEAAPPRRRRVRKVLVWTAAALVAVVVAIAAWWGLAKSGAVPKATITTAPPAAQSAAPLNVAQADACLGGPDPRHAVVSAQQMAPLDTVGAAEFALAVVRLLGTHPFAPDVDQVIDQVMVDGTQLDGLAAVTNAQDQAAGHLWRVIPPMRYRVLDNTGSEAVIQVDYMADLASTDPSAASADHSLVIDVHLLAVGGHWSVVPHPGSPPTPDAGDPTFTRGFVDYTNPGCGE